MTNNSSQNQNSISMPNYSFMSLNNNGEDNNAVLDPFHQQISRLAASIMNPTKVCILCVVLCAVCLLASTSLIQ